MAFTAPKFGKDGKLISTAQNTTAKPTVAGTSASLFTEGGGLKSNLQKTQPMRAAAAAEAVKSLNTSAPSEQASPRSLAAKLMKRQAGIGQLVTRHVEEEPQV